MNAIPPVRNNAPETKNQKFLRLMQNRLGRFLEDVRLMGQLSARSYEATPEQMAEVMHHVDTAIKDFARQFAVPYASKIGRMGQADSANVMIGAPPAPKIPETSSLKIEIARAIELIDNGNVQNARDHLSGLL